MEFVSYAQNLEDVILWRALQDVPNGYYVDVGAYDPVVDSVTAGFYAQGWHGLNIEANLRHLARLRAERPRDTNLAFAVSDRTGVLTFHEIENIPGGFGLSTGLPEFAEAHRAEGYAVHSRQVVAVRLADLLDLYGEKPIHFLKIDVEGMEREVLLGTDLRSNRPWIVLAEATKPNSPETCHERFEPVLLESGYRFAYFDGLNRFYVAEEHWTRLAAKVSVQPNVFDRYRRGH